MAARLNDLRAGAALALVALAVTACGRPTGDFGRAEPSFLHDTLLPAAGTFLMLNLAALFSLPAAFGNTAHLWKKH